MRKRRSREDLLARIKELKRQVSYSDKRLAEAEVKVVRVSGRNDFLLNELIEISQGLGIKPAWYEEGKSQWSSCIQNKAAIALKKTLRMD